MTTDEVIRAAVFCFGTLVIIGSTAELWYGPRRGMTWAQLLRYSSWVILAVTIMVAQYDHRYLPITRYTVAFALGLALGALGVLPQLRKPIRPPRK